MLIAESNAAPQHVSMLHDSPAEEIPALHHWSDVAFLQYSSAATTSELPLPLNYIFRNTITNPDTFAITSHVLVKQGYKDYEEWPGVIFDVDSEEGRAILGTPSGSGIVWLLAQHKQQLGEKRITKITLFCAETQEDVYRFPSLLFWIV